MVKVIAFKTAARGGARVFAGAALAMLFAVLVSLGGPHHAAFAADSSASASAASAEAAGGSSSSASAPSVSTEPAGHQSIVYATDEAKDSSERSDDGKKAFPAGMTSTWSIVNLVCAIANLAFSIALLSDAARKRVAGFVTRGRAIIGGVSAVLALLGILALSLTQNFAATMSVADELSFVFVVFLVVQVILFAIAKLGMSDASA